MTEEEAEILGHDASLHLCHGEGVIVGVGCSEIPDPAALVASHKQLVEAGEDALTGNLMALDRLKAALANARAVMGEV